MADHRKSMQSPSDFESIFVAFQKDDPMDPEFLASMFEVRAVLPSGKMVWSRQANLPELCHAIKPMRTAPGSA
jgi:hypothetical protein